MKYQATNKLRSKILKAFSGIFLLLSLSLLYIVYFSQNQVLDNFQITTNDYIHKTVDFTFKETTEHYSKIAHDLAKSPQLVEAVYTNNREDLFTLLKPVLDELREETLFFKTIHVIRADGTSLLRVHKKEEFNDPIINLRPMVQEIMRSKKTLVGYETGIHGIVFRVLVPIFYNEKFLGSLGLGVEPNFLMEQIGHIIKQKGALFIQDDKLKLYKKHMKSNLLFQDFRLQTQLNKENLDLFNSLPKTYSFEDNYSFEYNQKSYFLHIINVKDFQSNIHGKLVFIHNITKEINEAKNTQLYIILTLFTFLTLAFFTIRFIVIKFGNKMDKFYYSIISEVQKKENYLKAVEDNSSNIIITSSFEVNMIHANRRFFEFTNFSTLEDFKNEYNCICDLFISREGYLAKEVNGIMWLEYILQNPNQIHKAILLKEDKETIFKVTSSRIFHEGKEVIVSTFADITEIEEIRSRLSYAINGTKDGLWDWDLKTNEVYFSPRWKSMLGYEPDEIPNILKTWEERVHPDDLEKAVADIKANQQKKTDTYENIHRLKHKDGHWVWILDRGQTIFDDNGKPIRMLGFHTDITKRKEEEEVIKLQAKRAEALLKLPKLAEELDERAFVQKGQEITEDLTDSTIAFIHFVHEDEKSIELVSWSKRTLENYCNVDLDTYGTHYDASEAGIWANSMRTRQPFVVNNYPDFANKQGLPDGHAELQRFISVPVIENGKVVMMTGVGNKKEDYNSLDVETMQLISNDIWRTVQRNRTKEEVKQKDKMMLSQSRNAAMGEMISMIAHQWRQPLAVISMSANNILADIELDLLEEESLKESFKEIIYQTNELSKTIDDFKEFFKPVKKFEHISPKKVLDSAFKIIGKSLENNNVKVIEEINSTKEIQTYSRELMQVFLNIISNAKEVLLEKKIQKKQIKIAIEDIENGLIIRISDNGGGIPEKILDKVFEPYFSTKEERTGTGLGLYMSKIIIEKHLGGILSVENQEDGACFIIELLDVLPQSLSKKVE